MQEIFTEKYRPKKFEDFVGIEKYKVIVDLCKTPFKLPHFLFTGRAGTGKTTLAKIIINELNADHLILNASDESGIDTIRGKVKDFARHLALNPAVPKIIFLDEADFLGGNTSKTAQASLRAIIENYSKTVRFILSCNYEDKIIPELHSRLIRIPFGDYKKDEILKHLIKICNKENKTFNNEGLNKLILIYYPDIRSMINKIQQLNNLSIEFIKKDEEIYDIIYSMIKSSRLLEAKKNVIEKNLNCKELILHIFNLILEDTSINTQKKKNLIDIIAEVDYRLAVSASQEIQFFYFINKYCEIMRKI